MKKSSFFVLGMVTLTLTLGIVACDSSPPPRRAPTPNERLFNSASDGDLNGVISALQSGANINEEWGGSTALIEGSIVGHLEMVKYLVEHGANIDARSSRDATALIYAVNNGHKSVAQYLIDSSANVNARDKDGKSALNYAYEAGEMDLYDYLIAHGAKEFTPNPADPVQQSSSPAPAPQTNIYVQPSSPAPAPSAPKPASPQYTFSYNNSGGMCGTFISNQGGSITILNANSVIWKDKNGGNSSIGNASINGTTLKIAYSSGPFAGRQFEYTIDNQNRFSNRAETFSR